MKFITLLLVFSFVQSFAADVPGSIIYLKSDGELVEREMTLSVPSRGQGEVVLQGDNFKWSSSDFWTERTGDQVIFSVAFETSFRQYQSTIVFRGTYLKGDNQIVYYGDFLKKPGHGSYNPDLSEFSYSGGFRFEYDR